MDIIDFYRREQKRLHEWMREAVTDLTVEEWNTPPPGNGNSIAFLLWHSVRTEDNILHFILQGKPPIWNTGNWHERLHLPQRVQGTGMPSHDAREFHLSDPALFMTYVEEVWTAYESYLDSITDGGAELSDRMVSIKPVGDMPAIVAIGQVCLTHVFTHYGEISLLRGIMGKQGTTL